MPGLFGAPPIDWPADVRRWFRKPRAGSLVAVLVVLLALKGLFIWLGSR
jgi:hypothetical protein